MHDKKLLEALITNAQSILESNIEIDEVFKQWYAFTEILFKVIFGEDWTKIISWEGYKRGESYREDRDRLQKSVEKLKIAINTLVTLDAISHPQSENTSKLRSNQSDIRTFIVHGHDDKTKLEVKNYLQNTLKLPEPVILHEKASNGLTVIEKFEQYATETSHAFILLTPDDNFGLIGQSNDELYRARQNVIFEMGYFFGYWGRKSGKVILLYKGVLDIPSDITGIVYIDISNGIAMAGDQIRAELGL